MRDLAGRSADVEAVLERRTAVIRADASGSSRGQVLAANVDAIAVVVGLHPEPNLGRIERLLALAWESGAHPVVVLTKADLVADADDLADEVRRDCAGVDVVVCSTVTGAGIDELRALIGPRGTIGLVGASGHGKSSLTNALVGTEVLTTREIRADGKGRHTSVRRELVAIPGGGAIIDTPGLRGVGLQTPRRDSRRRSRTSRRSPSGAGSGTAVTSTSPAARSRRRSSRHLSARRLDSWLHLQRELAWMAARTDARLRAEQVKKWKKITEANRGRRRP